MSELTILSLYGTIAQSAGNAARRNGLVDFVNGQNQIVISTDHANPDQVTRDLRNLDLSDCVERIYFTESLAQDGDALRIDFAEICREFGVEPEDVLYVSDTIEDKVHARNAGVRVVHVPRFETVDEPFSFAHVDGFEKVEPNQDLRGINPDPDYVGFRHPTSSAYHDNRVCLPLTSFENDGFELTDALRAKYEHRSLETVRRATRGCSEIALYDITVVDVTGTRLLWGSLSTRGIQLSLSSGVYYLLTDGGVPDHSSEATLFNSVARLTPDEFRTSPFFDQMKDSDRLIVYNMDHVKKNAYAKVVNGTILTPSKRW